MRRRFIFRNFKVTALLYVCANRPSESLTLRFFPKFISCSEICNTLTLLITQTLIQLPSYKNEV